VATTGVTISEHFCQNKLISFSFVGNAHTCCCGHGCKSCHNDTLVQKVKKNFNSSTIKFGAVKVIDLLKFHTPFLIAQIPISPEITSINYTFKKAPPLINSETPEFLEVFRI